MTPLTAVPRTHRLFAPAIRVMHRLRYPQKFALVGILLLLPLLFLLSQYLGGINADIAFAERERQGLTYNAPVVALMGSVQRHGVLALIPSEADALAAERARVESAIAEADQVNMALGAGFEVDDDWEAFQGEWQRLLDDLPTLTPEAIAARTIALNERLLSILTIVGNNSNLILDPDIDSYYLMDTVITKLPTAASYMMELWLYSTLSATSGQLTPESSTRLRLLRNFGDATVNANRVGFGYATEYNPALAPQLDSLAADYQTNWEAIGAALDAHFASGISGETVPVTLSPNALFDQITPLAANKFTLYTRFAGELDALLQARIDRFGLQRGIVLVFTLIALLLTVWLFIGFYLAVKETIAALDQASQRMVKNEMAGAVVLSSRDELAEVAVAFNTIATELIRARDKAMEASRAKGVFLANMSHELRTPLNAILGFAQLLERDSKLTADQKENVATIGRSGEHLLALINNVLEMSKIEAGRITLNDHGFDLHRMLQGLQEMMIVRAQSKQLHLLLDLEPDMPRFYRADENKLRQVLINLVGNAIKFTSEGGIAVRVGFADGILLFEVEDSGEGIAPNEMGTLFEAFTQTASGRQSKHEGTGLGLPLSRQFVQLMGGDITVMSQPGKGSIFKFSVNAAPVEASDVEVLKKSRRVVGLAPGQRVFRILVVDDKFENRHLLAKLLKSVGFEIAEAENGQEAITKWEAWEPHLIWMDMRMPVMDGYEATQRIKATTKGQATVIIALTASVFEHERNIIASTGCDGFVSKPFRESDIFDMIARHLGTQFIYDDQQGSAPVLQAKKPALTPAVLASQSPAWNAMLHTAALQGDSEGMLALINQLPDNAQLIRDSLSELVRTYRFDLIIELLEQAGVHA